jgi:ribosome-associated translation inhibitor RaiA
MKSTIVAKGMRISQATRGYVTRQLRFALNQTQRSINFVTVRIDDLNGPQGGIDKRCQTHLTLPGLPDIVITDKGTDLNSAVARAFHRAALAVDRLLSRAKSICHTKDPGLALGPALI